MEYYVAVAGEKIGPVSQFKLVEMLRAGTISSQSQIWHRGLETWIPLVEEASMTNYVDVPPLSSPETEPVQVEKKHPWGLAAAHEVRPLLRFWARSFDYTLVMVVIVLFSDFELFDIQGGITLTEWKTKMGRAIESGELAAINQMTFFAMLVWHLLEGFLLHFFKTTPGKALFGISVTAAGNTPVSIINGIFRAFLVYILGVALLHVPLLVAIALSFSFFRLMTTGRTFWDKILKLEVKHSPLTVPRLLLAIGAFVLLLAL